MKKKLTCLLLAGLMVMGLGACGEAGTTETSTGSTETGTTSTASGDVRKIVVGTGNGAAPFCYLDEDGNSIGYDIDVLKELDKRLEQYEFEIQAMDFSTLIVSIDSGSINFLAHELVQSDARKEKYLFPSEYYCLSPMCLAVKDDSGITSMADMAGKTMELNPSQYEYQMVEAYNAAHPGAEVDLIGVADQTTADAYLKVSNGKVDASLTYKATFESVIPEIGIQNLVTTEVVMCEDTYLMFPTTEKQLCDDISACLKEMKEDGTLSKISLEWYGEDVFGLYSDMISITTK